MENNINFFLYEKLTNASLDTLKLVWTGNKYYEAEHLSDEEIIKLNNLAATKIRFEGAGSNRGQYDRVFEQAHTALKEMVFSSDIPAYLILVEHCPKIKSRIRSYKGILPKENLPKDSYIEIEFDLDGTTTSLFIAAVTLTSENFTLLIDKIGDNRKGFIFQSFKPVLSKIFLEDVFYKTIDGCQVNYRNLIIEFIEGNNDKIYRISGDGGDYCLDIDTFFHQTSQLLKCPY